MKKRHTILELPNQDEEFDKIISDINHQVTNVEFSSLKDGEKTRHYVLVVWHDYEYGDHIF